MVGLAAGCVPVPPRPIALDAVPTVTGAACNVTVVRKKQSAGSFPNYYVVLDRLAVASLRPGDYTTFPVAAGRHTLAVVWRVGDTPVTAGGPGGGAAILFWSPHAKFAELNCAPPGDSFFTLTARALPIDENDRVELRQVERLDGDFSLERNRHVALGPR